ncbi:MAG: dihydroneopterin aldolase [Candidatus Omnitrophica bacterium]|nr:dihydroneopterin aldolase [Candidatus Omnitrophota bacterium]
MDDKVFLEALQAKCIIGIFDWERKIKQKVLIDLEIPSDVKKAAGRDRIQDALDYKQIAKHTLRFVSKSRFYLIETLAERLAESLLRKFRLPAVKIRVSKPGAIRGARSVGVEMTRRKRRASGK